MGRTDAGLPIFRLVVLWALGLAGCALRPPAEMIEPHLVALAPPDVPSDRPVLGVGLFTDARPPASPDAAEPEIELHWWGLSRRGTDRTGDAAFASSVAEGARRDAAATFARSGAFSQVVWVDADAQSAAERARRGDVDWVLVGEVEQLAAAQYRDSVLNVGRVGWLRSRDSDPEGRATLRYELVDATGDRVDLSVTQNHQSPGRTLSGAALDALAAANEQAASDLYRVFVPESQRRLREVPVLLLDGCGFGEGRAQRLFEDASRIFEREAGVCLEVERRAWIPPAGVRSLEPALEQLLALEPPADGFVVALVPVSSSALDSRRGLALPLGRHIAIGCRPDSEVRPLTIAHEIGHLFGAVHVEDRASVMYPRTGFDARFFDLLNRRILRATQARSFGGPLDPAAVRELEEIYAEARGFASLVRSEDLDAAVTALQRVDPRGSN